MGKNWFDAKRMINGISGGAKNYRRTESQGLRFFFIAFILTGMAMACNSTANSATLQVIRRVVIPIDMDPTDIHKGADGNYVITGTLVDPRSDLVLPAAAIKLTPEGKIIWQYASPFVNPKRYPAITQSYSNSIEMDDGSVFLCGRLFNVPSIGIKKMAFLVTHLSSDGRLISEQNFPLDKSQSISACAKFGDGFALIGERSEAYLDGFKSFADIWYFNKNGKLIWEKKFLLAGDLQRDVISKDIMYIVSESEICDKGHCQAQVPKFGPITITRVSPQGEVKNFGQVKGFLGAWGRVAVPALRSNDSDIFMFGVTNPSEYESTTPNRVIVKFDSDMNEISRTKIAKLEDLVLFQRIFSQPDGSFFYFGSVAKPFSNLSHMGVAYTSADFSRQAKLAIVPDDFDDFPYVNVATSTGKLNQFVAVSRLRVKGFYKDAFKGIVDADVERKFPASTDPGIYLVLQFIQLTN